MSYEIDSSLPESNKKPTSSYWEAGVFIFLIHAFHDAGVFLSIRSDVDFTKVSPQFKNIYKYAIYHFSDLNNSLFLAATLDTLIGVSIYKLRKTDRNDKEKKISAFFSGLIVALIFTLIERKDWRDLPAAYLGAWVYVASRISYLNMDEELKRKSVRELKDVLNL